MHTSSSTSDTPFGASLLFDTLYTDARAAGGCDDMGSVVRGILVWVDQRGYDVRVLVQGAGRRWAIHVVN
jgi:hypothetical protein